MAEARLRRSTDIVNASRIAVPLQLVIVILGAALAAALSVWTIEAGLRSDVRNLATQMEGQAREAKLERQLDESNAARQAEKLQVASDALRATVETIQREQRLMQIEMQNFRESVLTMQGRK